MNHRRLLGVAFALVLLASAVPAAEIEEGPDPDAVVAAVDGQIILWREILSAIGPLQPGQTLEERRALVEAEITKLIQRILIKKAARRIGIRADRRQIEARIQKEREAAEARGMELGDFLSERGVTLPQLRRSLEDESTIQGFLGSIMGLSRRDPRNPMDRPLEDSFIRPEEVRRYYLENRERWRRPAEVRIRTMYVKNVSFLDGPGEEMENARLEARARARELREKVLAGEEFAKLARELAGVEDEPELKTENQLPTSYREWAFRGEAGSISELIELRGGWLIVKIEERHPARVVPFEDVQEMIKDQLHGLRNQRNEARVLLRLLDEAEISPPDYKMALRHFLRIRLSKLR